MNGVVFSAASRKYPKDECPDERRDYPSPLVTLFDISE